MAKSLQSTKWNNVTNAHSLASLTSLATKKAMTDAKTLFGFAQVADEDEIVR